LSKEKKEKLLKRVDEKIYALMMSMVEYAYNRSTGRGLKEDEGIKLMDERELSQFLLILNSISLSVLYKMLGAHGNLIERILKQAEESKKRQLRSKVWLLSKIIEEQLRGIAR